MISRITAFFPLWAIFACAAAYGSPDIFAPLRWTIVPLLAVIMFGMGLTLIPQDFRRFSGPSADAARRQLRLSMGAHPQRGGSARIADS